MHDGRHSLGDDAPGSAAVPAARGFESVDGFEIEPSAAGTAALPAGLPAAKGWYSRGYLPHFDLPHLIQGITFRLADALPLKVLEQWSDELSHLEETKRGIEQRRRIEKYLDAGHGECLLRDPQAARVVQDSLLHFDQQRYALIAWCVMPNHVHALLETWERWPLAGVVHAWKSFTAHEINKLLQRSGAVWQREYHDRFIRDAEHFTNAMSYIEQNPVKVGLMAHADQWPWGNASHRQPNNSVIV